MKRLFAKIFIKIIKITGTKKTLHSIFGDYLFIYLLFFSIKKNNISKEKDGILCVKRNLFDKIEEIEKIRDY
jgi:hypothetical protein